MTWHPVSEKPPILAYCWIFMPNLLVGDGIMIAQYSSRGFVDMMREKWPQEEITHWKEIERPEKPEGYKGQRNKTWIGKIQETLYS